MNTDQKVNAQETQEEPPILTQPIENDVHPPEVHANTERSYHPCIRSFCVFLETYNVLDILCCLATTASRPFSTQVTDSLIAIGQYLGNSLANGVEASAAQGLRISHRTERELGPQYPIIERIGGAIENTLHSVTLGISSLLRVITVGTSGTILNNYGSRELTNIVHDRTLGILAIESSFVSRTLDNIEHYLDMIFHAADSFFVRSTYNSLTAIITGPIGIAMMNRGHQPTPETIQAVVGNIVPADTEANDLVTEETVDTTSTLGVNGIIFSSIGWVLNWVPIPAFLRGIATSIAPYAQTHTIEGLEQQTEAPQNNNIAAHELPYFYTQEDPYYTGSNYPQLDPHIALQADSYESF